MYNYPNYNPYYPPPGMPPQGVPPSEQGKKWRGRDWFVKVVLPILAILATAGYFGHASGGTTTPTIPILHSSYTGSLANIALQRQFPFTVWNLSESSAGDFTATATDGICVGPITNGRVTADGKITFEWEAQGTATCLALTGDFTGNVNSSGGITGTWSANGGSQGSFMLS